MAVFTVSRFKFSETGQSLLTTAWILDGGVYRQSIWHSASSCLSLLNKENKHKLYRNLKYAPCKIQSLHTTLTLKQWCKSNKWTGNGKDFWVIALHFPQVRGYRDFNPCSCRVAIVLDQDNIVWVKARSHARSRHFVSNDKCLFLLSLDGQQHSVANFSHTIFVVDMDHSWRTVVRCISKGAVVNHSHSCQLLNGCCGSRNTVQYERNSTTYTSWLFSALDCSKWNIVKS